MRMDSRQRERSFVVCVANEGFEASLVVRRIYEAIPDAEGLRSGCVRVIDESGEDYLFPETLFAEIDLPKAIREKIALPAE